MSKTILIVGASRGIGHAMAAEFVSRGWNVIGTLRGDSKTALHDLAESNPGRVDIQQLDITQPEQIAQLRAALSGRELDMLVVNAGTTNRDPTQTIAEVSTDEFVHVMVTNALSPMRVLEGLQALVRPTGLLGVMSSGQGSVTNNVAGQREVYRGSKAALNQYMRCFAAREQESGTPRAMVLMAPGWIKTGLGGDNAPFTLEENVPKIVNVMLEKQTRPGLEYLDFQGKTVPW